MAAARTPRIRLIALLAVVLVTAPQVGATPHPEDLLVGRADVMHHRGALQERGDLAMYQVAAEAAVQAPSIVLEAASGHGWYFETDTLRTKYWAVNVPSTGETAIGSASEPLRDLSLHTMGGAPKFDLRILAADQPPPAFQARLRGGTDLTSLPMAEMTHYGGLQERHENNTPVGSPTDRRQQSFVHWVVDEPVVFTEARGGTVDLRVEGDFILEFYGLDVVLQAGEGPKRPVSTRHTTSGDNPTETAVEHWQILRLILEDATLTFHHADVDRAVRWVSFATAVEGDDGSVRFEGLQGPEGGLLGAQEVSFLNGYTGVLVPGGDRLAVELAQSPGAQVVPASAWLVPTGFSALPIAAFLVVAALAAVVARMARRAPRLEHMEDALEAGSFGRAARVAGRILRSDPTRESAHLGRAIALSRTGRPERVVKDLKRYLRDNEPSDGTLHYVLGLAYRDLGKEAAAAEALSEAVQRTPALAEQVPDVPAPPRRSLIEGDAQGYT